MHKNRLLAQVDIDKEEAKAHAKEQERATDWETVKRVADQEKRRQEVQQREKAFADRVVPRH